MYLSLDVGTTVIKAVLFSPSGQEVQVAEQACPTVQTPQGGAEQDPEALARAMWGVLREILTSPHGGRGRGSGTPPQVVPILPLDQEGVPTHRLITWMDQRPKPIVAQWRQSGTHRQIRACSGWWPEEGLPLATITWFREHCPQAFARTAHFCSVNDYLVYLLTGRYLTNPSCGGEMLLMNPVSHTWHPDMLALAGITAGQCSEIAPADAVAGVLSPQAQARLGICRAIPVYNGGQDHTLEALAVGMTGPGQALLACGTAWVINTAAGRDQCARAPEALGMNPHILPDRWVLSEYLGCFGAVNEWWCQTMWQAPGQPLSRSTLYDQINRSLGGHRAGGGNLFYLPYSGGKQLGLCRQEGIFWGGSLDQSREDWTWAVLEGIVFEVRWALEQLARAQMPIDRLWMIGGATRSPVWPQLAADILGIPIVTSQYSHGPALGAAMIAGVGCGQFSSFDDCRQVFRMEGRVFLPEQEYHRRYQEKYARFLALSAQLVDI